MKVFTALFAFLLFADKPPERIDWMRLRGLNYKTGRMNADVKAIDGADVRIVGFMVPFDDEDKQTSEFLLVPGLGQCVHTPPPPPNQIVIVKMESGKKADIFWDKPIWVDGKLKVETAKSPYGNVLFSLVATRVEADKGY